MNSEPAGARGTSIRSAISCGEIPKALVLWQEYAAELRCAIQHGTASESHMAEMRELVEWSVTALACARAHALHRLNSSRKVERVAAAYGRTFRLER